MSSLLRRKMVMGGLCFMVMALMFVVGELESYAALKDDSGYYYAGIIEPKRANTRFGVKKRTTTKKSDPFYVRLDKSGEGKKTVTRFWLENKKGDNLCDTVDVTQGKGWYPRNTYQSGCNTNVYLTAENNNYNYDVYEVSGRWLQQ